ncbi:MAG: phosphatidate cytidylyltransferase [Treponema sp.]|nr:phosphatidate cytidylyltransferase [Treponema sp.]
MKTELIRKGIHALVALAPWLALVNRSHTALLLMGGVFFYACVESLRFVGFSPPFVSSVTNTVLREREQGRFALGPITLGLGALLALLLFPPQAAAAGIYALAFGDSAATIAGRLFGRVRPAFMAGKSLEGSLACFAAATLSCFLVFRDWRIALATGIVSMLVEAFSVRDFDNLLLPLAAGFTASMAALVF